MNFALSRHPDYYQLIEEPIDLKDIESNILTGQYKTVESFDADFIRLFNNVQVNNTYYCIEQ